jgi:putative cardiolipin synthase
LRLATGARISFLGDFERLNRRMHNKSFTADNQATIVGGRNVGDEYFRRRQASLLYFDLDVLAIGPVVSGVSEDFDRYWKQRILVSGCLAASPSDTLVSHTSKSARGVAARRGP